MCSWIGQWLDHIPKEEDRARPTMGEDDRQRVRMFRSYVDEVNAEAIDLRAKLWELIQCLLAASPVVIGAPVVDESTQLLEGNALRPVVSRLALRPARLCQTLLQVVQRVLRRMIGEWYDLFEFHLL